MAQQVAAGNLESRARVWSQDGIGEVAAAINQMTDHLVTTQADLERTNRRLDAINRVILAADRETEIIGCGVICKQGWGYGRIVCDLCHLDGLTAVCYTQLHINN